MRRERLGKNYIVGIVKNNSERLYARVNCNLDHGDVIEQYSELVAHFGEHTENRRRKGVFFFTVLCGAYSRFDSIWIYTA